MIRSFDLKFGGNCWSTANRFLLLLFLLLLILLQLVHLLMDLTHISSCLYFRAR